MPSVNEAGKSISFERWINGMSDDEYADMLDDSNPFGFSDAQEEKALNIRSPPTIQDELDLEELQEGIRKDREPIEFSQGVTEIPQRTGEPIRVERTGERVTMTREPAMPRPAPIPAPRMLPPPRPNIGARIGNALRQGFSFARRFFRI